MLPHVLLALALAWRYHLSADDALRERARILHRAATAHGVRVELLAAVCWVESRVGTAPVYASLCGVRLGHVYVRDDARSADVAARTLAGSVRRCGSERDALAAYRVGGTCADPRGDDYALDVLATARSIARAQARVIAAR